MKKKEQQKKKKRNIRRSEYVKRRDEVREIGVEPGDSLAEAVGWKEPNTEAN